MDLGQAIQAVGAFCRELNMFFHNGRCVAHFTPPVQDIAILSHYMPIAPL
jgi:hypothetical protein